MKQILIYTASGKRNLGDELILLSEYQFLRARYGEARIVYATYDSRSNLLPKDPLVSSIGYFPDHIKQKFVRNIRTFIRSFFETRKSDLVIIGGGGLIYDDEQGQSFPKLLLEWSIRLAFARFWKVPVLFWGLGIHVSEAHAKWIRRLFVGARVTVRDASGRKILSDLDIHCQQVPDSAFFLEVPKRAIPRVSSPKIWLALRKGYFPNDLENVKDIVHFLKKEGYEVYFLNHSFHPDSANENDALWLQDIADRFGVHSTQSIEETYSLYQDMRFIVSMRLHANILGCLYGVPFVSLSYGKKTKAFLDSIGYPHSIDCRNFSLEDFQMVFSRIVEHEDTLKFALERENGKIRQESLPTLYRLFHELERHRRQA